jgi:hypothetical protein
VPTRTHRSDGFHDDFALDGTFAAVSAAAAAGVNGETTTLTVKTFQQDDGARDYSRQGD